MKVKRPAKGPHQQGCAALKLQEQWVSCLTGAESQENEISTSSMVSRSQMTSK